MNPSDELKNVMLRFYESISLGDMSAIERLFSRASGVLVIGSDANEWWSDHDTIVQAFKTQFQEMGIRKFEPGELNAFVESTVGWVSERRTIQLPNGKEMTLRETTVVHKEDGEWKIVQLHVSLAIPNAEAFNKEPIR